MIPSSSGDSYSSFEPLPDVDSPQPIDPVDDKTNSVADKWLDNINAQIAKVSSDSAREYYIAAKDETSASEMFKTLMTEISKEADILEQIAESNIEVAEVAVQDPVQVELTDEQFAYWVFHFQELLDNVVESRNAAHDHDFRVFVERVAGAVGERVDELMPNESDDIAYVHEAWKKLGDHHHHMQDVVSLDLSNLHLRALPQEIAEMVNLEELILSNNKLLTLPKEIAALTHLKRLLVDNNVLKSVPKELGELYSLIELDLSNNRLEKIPESFGKLVNLQSLNLSVNRLTEHPQQLNGLKNLTDLVLFGNRF